MGVIGCVLFCFSVVYSEHRKDKEHRREEETARSEELLNATTEKEGLISENCIAMSLPRCYHLCTVGQEERRAAHGHTPDPCRVGAADGRCRSA